MDSKALFKKAKSKADGIPMVYRTPLLISNTMMAEVAQWISNQDYSMALSFDGDRAISILKTANEAIDMIGDYMREEIL